MKPLEYLTRIAVLVLIFLGISKTINAGEILSLSNLEVTKENPASFVLYGLNSGEQIFVDFAANKGSLNKLKLEVISTVGSFPETIKIISSSGDNFIAPESGNYHIKFISEEDINLNLIIYSSKNTPKEGTLSYFKFECKILEVDQDLDKLRFKYRLEPGDVIRFNSGDQKSAGLKVHYSQGSNNKYVGAGAEFTIEVEGDNVFYISFDNDDPTINDLINRDKKFLKIFGKKDYSFKDIHVVVTRQSESTPTTRTADANTPGGISNAESIAQQQLEEARQARLESKRIQEENLELLRKNAKTAEDRNRVLMEEYKLRIEEAAYEKEMAAWEASKAIIEVSHNLKHDGTNNTMTVMPVKNIAGAGKVSKENGDRFEKYNNRACMALTLPSEELEFPRKTNWFYVVYVGNKSKMDSFIQHKMPRELGESPGFNIWKQEAINYHRIYHSLSHGHWKYAQGNRYMNLRWPNEKEDKELFSEDIDYAIIKESEKNNYLTGKPFLPENEQKNIKIDRGYLALLPSKIKENMFFCATNNNLTTPVDVVFYYAVTVERNNNELIEDQQYD